MEITGIRQLKDRLSHYVRLAQQGHQILITDRGKVVASLGPPERTRDDGLPPGLVELARLGGARLGAPNRPELYGARARVCARDLSAEVLDELRRER